MNIAELEARLKEIDAVSKTGDIKVGVSGNTESNGTMKVDLSKKGLGIAPVKKTMLDLDMANVDVPDDYIKEKINFAIQNPKASGISDVVIREVDPSGVYELIQEYTYEAKDYKITAKEGFKFDRASIPRIFWVLIAKDDLSNVAPLFHDMLYRSEGTLEQDQVIDYRTFTKDEADILFYEIMLKRGVKKWRAYAAYLAVSNFAGFAWGSKLNKP